MRVQLRLSCSTNAIRVALAGAAALLLAGCSSESTRFFEDGRSDLTPTATIPNLSGRNAIMPGGGGVNGLAQQGAATYATQSALGGGTQALGAGALSRGSAIQSTPLAPVSGKSLASKAVSAPRPSFSAPATPSPQASLRQPTPAPMSTASINKPAPASNQAPLAKTASISGWSAEGGTPIIVAQGETAAMLATRYGVPGDALVRVNGFSSASQIQPGARLVVPVYTGARATSAAAKPAALKQTATQSAKTPASAQDEDKAPASVRVAEAPKTEARKPEAAKVEKPVKAVVATAPAKPKEKLRFVKGAEPAAKLKPVETAKAAPLKPVTVAEAKATKPVETKSAEGKPSKMVEAKAAKAAKPVETAKLAKPIETAKAAKPVETAKVEAPAEKLTKKQIAEARLQQKQPVVAQKAPDNVDHETTTGSVDPKAANVGDPGDKPEFRWPARGRVIQGFKAGANDGINIALPEGTSIKAAEGGTVIYSGSELKGYGNMVLIKHPNGYVSAYANNGDIAVKRGDKVARGQTIAKSGQTGNVASPQLHFELRKDKTPVDPTGFLAGL